MWSNKAAQAIIQVIKKLAHFHRKLIEGVLTHKNNIKKMNKTLKSRKMEVLTQENCKKIPHNYSCGGE